MNSEEVTLNDLYLDLQDSNDKHPFLLINVRVGLVEYSLPIAWAVHEHQPRDHVNTIMGLKIDFKALS